MFIKWNNKDIIIIESTNSFKYVITIKFFLSNILSLIFIILAGLSKIIKDQL